MLYFEVQKRNIVRSGIRTHAWRTRLRPERSALDSSAIVTCTEVELKEANQYFLMLFFEVEKRNIVRMGIGTHSWRNGLQLDHSGLERSAIMTCTEVELKRLTSIL